MVWNVGGVFQLPDKDKHNIEDVGWGGKGSGKRSEQRKQDEEDDTLITTGFIIKKPNDGTNN